MKKLFSWKNPIFGAIILTLLVMISLWIGVINKIIWLENTIPSMFSALATLLVGLYAFILYKKQKDDLKKDAANILLLELQNAEKVLKLAQRSLKKALQICHTMLFQCQQKVGVKANTYLLLISIIINGNL